MLIIHMLCYNVLARTLSGGTSGKKGADQRSTQRVHKQVRHPVETPLFQGDLSQLQRGIVHVLYEPTLKRFRYSRVMPCRNPPVTPTSGDVMTVAEQYKSLSLTATDGMEWTQDCMFLNFISRGVKDPVFHERNYYSCIE